MAEDLITLNIGGSLFKTLRSTMNKYPCSKLGKLSPESANYISKSNEYFFDRNPELFNVVLEYYRCDDEQLHLPSYICGSLLLREFEFWEIPIESISDCCFRTYTNYENDQAVRHNLHESRIAQQSNKASQSKKVFLRERAWLFFDQPHTSRGATVFFIIFMAMVVLSVVTSCLVTEPSLRDEISTPEGDNDTKPNFKLPSPGSGGKSGMTNGTKSSPNPKLPGYKGKYMHGRHKDNHRTRRENELSWKLRQFIRSKPKTPLIVIQKMTDAFFGIELILHFILCPYKKHFLKSSNNKIDAFVFVFVVVFYVVEALAEEYMIFETYRLFFVLSNVTVMFKLLRFFRLTKIYKELQILLLAIKASSKVLVLLGVTFGIFAVVFGNLIYYTELTEPETFPNVFVGIWWAVVTMTTVGYGDEVPKSLPGYLTGVITAMSGLLIIAMPVAIIARNFDGYYSVHNDKVSKRQKCTNQVVPCLKSTNAFEMIKYHLHGKKKKENDNF